MTRAPMTAVDKAVHDFLYQREQEVYATTMKNRGRDNLRAFLLEEDNEDIRIDESGHRYYDLPEPLNFGKQTYAAICAQRRLSSRIDLDAVEAYAREHGLLDEIFPVVPQRQFDEDSLYALNQRGIVSDDVLDSFITEDETFAIVPVKA